MGLVITTTILKHFAVTSREVKDMLRQLIIPSHPPSNSNSKIHFITPRKMCFVIISTFHLLRTQRKTDTQRAFSVFVTGEVIKFPTLQHPIA